MGDAGDREEGTIQEMCLQAFLINSQWRDANVTFCGLVLIIMIIIIIIQNNTMPLMRRLQRRWGGYSPQSESSNRKNLIADGWKTGSSGWVSEWAEFKAPPDTIRSCRKWMGALDNKRRWQGRAETLTGLNVGRSMKFVVLNMISSDIFTTTFYVVHYWHITQQFSTVKH